MIDSIVHCVLPLIIVADELAFTLRGAHTLKQACQMLKQSSVDGALEFNCLASLCTGVDLIATLHMAQPT